MRERGYPERQYAAPDGHIAANGLAPLAQLRGLGGDGGGCAKTWGGGALCLGFSGGPRRGGGASVGSAVNRHRPRPRPVCWACSDLDNKIGNCSGLTRFEVSGRCPDHRQTVGWHAEGVAKAARGRAGGSGSSSPISICGENDTALGGDVGIAQGRLKGQFVEMSEGLGDVFGGQIDVVNGVRSKVV